MKKFIIPFLAILFLGWLRLSDPWMINVIRLKALDYHQQQQEVIETADIVTIEIDDRTMRESGYSWPWPKELLAEKVMDIWNQGASVIVIPALFSEPDGYGGDEYFTEALLNTNTIIGQIPSNDVITTPVSRGVATIGDPWQPWVYEYPTISGPRPEFADAAIGVGIMNTSPETDGVLRRMPLVVQSNGELFPSIPLETVRVLAGDISYQMRTNVAGVDALRIPKYKTITTDSFANVWIDFKYRTPTYSLADELPNLEFKTVILTPTGAGTDNTIATPVGRINDYDVIATSVQTIIDGRNISRPYWSDLLELGIAAGGALLLMLLVLYTPFYVSGVALVAALFGSFWYSGYTFRVDSYLIDWSYPVAMMFIVWSTAAFIRFVDEYKQKQAIKKQFAGYASPTIVRMLQENPSLIKDGMKKEVSICFSDLRGFTPLGESFGDDVKGLTKIMNGYMDAITQPILDSNGMVIKYIGDASMHIHNAPIDDPDHPKSAVQTGLNMLKAVEIFNEKITAEGRPPVGMGAGINTGLGYLGEMGSTKRHSYDVLGDAVSTAARIESKCKEYGCLLLVGESTYEQTKDDFFYLKIDDLAVKGKSVGISIYTVLGDMEWVWKNTNWVRAQTQHDKMHELYRAKQFDTAIHFCKDLMDEFDGKMKGYYTMWIERCEFQKTQDLPEDWDGTFIATTK